MDQQHSTNDFTCQGGKVVAIHSTDGHIVDALTNLIQLEGVSKEEDFQTYRQTTKKLLEQLLLKLEENVEYESNLESQIQSLESELEQLHTDSDKKIDYYQGELVKLQADAELKIAELSDQLDNELHQKQSLELLLKRTMITNTKLEVVILSKYYFLKCSN